MGMVSVFESVSFPRRALLSLPKISIDRMISCRVTGILLIELSLGMASSDGKNNRRRTRAASSAFFTCRLVYFNLLSVTVLFAITLGFEASKQYSPPTLSKSKVSHPSC